MSTGPSTLSTAAATIATEVDVATPGTTPITITPGAVSPVDVPVLSGAVVAPGGSPRAGIVLQISSTSGTFSATVTTDSAGKWSRGVPYGWSGSIAPQDTSEPSSPGSIQLSNVQGNISGLNFTVGAVVPTTVTLSGSLRDIAGRVFPDVSLAVTGVGLVTTDASGNYAAVVPYDWTGTITPQLAGYTLEPSSRSYTSVKFDMVNQNFLATLIVSNLPPIANPQSGVLDEDSSLTLTLTASDPEGHATTLILDSLPGEGTLTDDSNSTVIQQAMLPYTLGGSNVTYAPAANYHGADHFYFHANDGTDDGNPALVDLSVTSVHDVPVIQQGESVNLSVAADSAGTASANRTTLSATSPDAGAGTLNWTASSPAHGTVSITGTPSSSGASVTVAYTPAAGYTGSDSFSVTVTDDQGASDSLQVNVDVGAPVVISGKTRNYLGTPVSGVVVTATDGGGVTITAASDGAGDYSLGLPSGWTGTIDVGVNWTTAEGATTYINLVASGTLNLTAARRRYVSPSGNNANAGLLTSPYLTIQAAINASAPGEVVEVMSGTYTGGPAANVPFIQVPATKAGVAGFPLTVRVMPGATVLLSGNAQVNELVQILASYVNFEDFEITRARRIAVKVGSGAATHHVYVRNCYAHDCNLDLNFIGGAFRLFGPVQFCEFVDCWADACISGFEMRENPTQTKQTCSTPPIAGNIGFAAALPESQWDSWLGWTQFASRYCAIRRCLATNCTTSSESSNGYAPRYGIEYVVEDCIGFKNGDDNFDGVGATRAIYRRNIAFQCNPLNDPNADGNGMKVGVRGGLDNVLHHNISFDNKRAGIDVADTERGKIYHNTCFNNKWFGIWFEAVRSTVGASVLNNVLYKNGIPNQGDLGRNGAATHMAVCDYNTLGDANTHNWAIPHGGHTQVSTDPKFADETKTIDTVFPANLTIPEKMTFIRDQVIAKLGLAADSPALNNAVAVAGINDTYAAIGGGIDRGAVESH